MTIKFDHHSDKQLAELIWKLFRDTPENRLVSQTAREAVAELDRRLNRS